MTLIDEREIMYEQEKKQKIFKTIIKAIIILIILTIILLVYISTKDLKKVKISVDGNSEQIAEKGLVLKDERGQIFTDNGQIYISVNKLSTLLNIQYYNGEYKKKDEDKMKCQIKTNNEYTSYIANSNKVYKTITKDINILNDVEYEYFDVNNNVKYVNGEVYASIEAIKLGFNISLDYDVKKERISIYTLDYLENMAKSKRSDVVSSSEYDYTNKRLLKYGMSIVKDNDGNLGVGSYTNFDKLSSCVVSCKYSSIQFNEAARTLTVITKNDNKKCIIYLNLDNQEVIKTVTSQYTDIKEIDNYFEYFLIKDKDKYGIMNSDGKIILYTLFDEIGVNEGIYTDIDNKYILNKKYIPVKQNGVWGLYNIEGKKIINPQYADIGCPLQTSGDAVVSIQNIKQNINGIVFLYNKDLSLYGLYNADTGEKIAISLSEVFKKIENEEENYYIRYVVDLKNAVIHTINVKDI